MNFGWTYDEVVLAADLVARNDLKGLRAHHQPVIELSDLLRAAPIHPVEEREDNFRSPSSVQRKTFDIATQHKEHAGTPTKGGRFDVQVLGELVKEPEHMRAVADAIRSTILEREVASVPNQEIESEEISADEGSLWPSTCGRSAAQNSATQRRRRRWTHTATCGPTRTTGRVTPSTQ